MFLPIGKVFKKLEDSANDHHEDILAMIAEGNAEGAATAMQHHIATSRESLENLMPKQDRKRARVRAPAILTGRR